MDYIITEKEKKIKLSYLRSRIKHQSWSYLNGLDAEERRVVEVLGTKPLLFSEYTLSFSKRFATKNNDLVTRKNLKIYYNLDRCTYWLSLVNHMQRKQPVSTSSVQKSKVTDQ